MTTQIWAIFQYIWSSSLQVSLQLSQAYHQTDQKLRLRAISGYVLQCFIIVFTSFRLCILYVIIEKQYSFEGYSKIDFLFYYFVKYYAKFDRFYVISLALIKFQSIFTVHYNFFFLSADCQTIITDIRNFFYISHLNSLDDVSILTFTSRASVLAFFERLQKLPFRMNFISNQYLRKKEKVIVLVIFKAIESVFRFSCKVVRLGFLTITLICISLNFEHPDGVFCSLLVLLDLFIIESSVYLYLRTVFFDTCLGLFIATLLNVSLWSQSWHLKRAIVERRAASVYSTMIHLERLFVKTFSEAVKLNRTLVRSTFTYQVCGAGLAITIMIVSASLQDLSWEKRLSMWSFVALVLSIISFSTVIMILASKFLYRYTLLVMRCNVFFAKYDRCLRRKVKASLFFELLSSRKVFTFTLRNFGKITSKALMNCLLFYSYIVMALVRYFYEQQTIDSQEFQQ